MFDIERIVAGAPEGATLDDLLVAVVDALSAVDPGELSDAGLSERVTGLHRQAGRLEAERLRLLAAHDRRMVWAQEGARSQKEWLAARCGLTRGEAGGDVETARQLTRLPGTAAAMARGAMTASQVRIVSRMAARVDSAAREELDAVAVAVIAPQTSVAGAGADVAGQTTDAGDAVDAVAAMAAAATVAGPGGGDSRQLRVVVEEWAHRRDAGLLAEQRAAAHAARRVTVVRAGDGSVVLDGRLDPLGGETLLTALGSLSGPAGQDDDRTPEQRRADALTELARRCLDAGMLPSVAGERPHVTVVVPVEALQRRPEAGPARLDHVGAVAGEAARMVACDATITRVVMAGVSQPLDVGRATRTVTSAQRRALVVRDQGCRGCGAPPAWCQAHHIRHWADGGATDRNNLVLLCWTCHDNVHHHGWRLARGPDRRWLLRPPDRLAPRPSPRRSSPLALPSAASPPGASPPVASPPDASAPALPRPGKPPPVVPPRSLGMAVPGPPRRAAVGTPA